MSYLTEEQISAIQSSLEGQIEEIKRNMQARRDEEFEPETRGDEADIANSEGIAATLDRLHTRDIRLLKKLDEALIWLKDEDFGYCEECGEEIGFKRLLARPAARMCIECKQKQEQVERGFYHPRPRKPKPRSSDLG
ncbi:MAG: TraR/DksA C4-type zinc finger protein [Myxococcota bacterium]|jgi:DnaK suppressor protein|nr:TraR/DksA C4-type zinc finger protein [Myxococcota bacterium]